MTVWDFANQSFAAGSTATQPRHLGVGATFVDKDQTVGIKLGLVLGPCDARRSDIRPILLGRAKAFF